MPIETGQKGRIVRVTYKAGTKLLDHCRQPFPVQFNDEIKFPSNERATFERNATHLFKAIKKVSPGFQMRPLMMTLFGDPANWKERERRMMPAGGGKMILAPNEPIDPNYTMKDESLEVPLDLNAYARDAASMICLKLSHPDGHESYHLSAADQEEIVFPLAEALGCLPWLEKKIGYGTQKSDIEYQDPPTPAVPATT